ncbi:MAG: peptidyl-prolyl cis-trans isomerase [Vicinamibacteria bacterium]|nr:peptidyl-prolyl cis-trans isomerase [Vicinamibacteria bacterium]
MNPCLFLAVLALALQPDPSPAVVAPSPFSSPAAIIVSLETTMGAIELSLDRERAPITVESFLKYVRKGFYDGTVFHRVIPGFMIQGGGLTQDMSKKSTLPPIRNESSNGLNNLRGTIAMARLNDPDSATSQFFINVNDNVRALDAVPGKPGYAVFGAVVSGMDVVDRIAAVPTEQRGVHHDVPKTPVVILSARLVTDASKPQNAPPREPASAPTTP